MKRSVWALALVLLAGFFAAIPAYAELTVSDMEGELMCQCGCSMVLEPCRCGTADQMRTLIGEMIDEGQTKQQILDYFVAQYGEDALSAPAKKGFNLLVWVLPFAAIVVGGGGLYFWLRRWSSQEEALAVEAIPESRHGDEPDKYRQRFEEEFDQFKREDDSR